MSFLVNVHSQSSSQITGIESKLWLMFVKAEPFLAFLLIFLWSGKSFVLLDSCSSFVADVIFTGSWFIISPGLSYSFKAWHVAAVSAFKLLDDVTAIAYDTLVLILEEGL